MHIFLNFLPGVSGLGIRSGLFPLLAMVLWVPLSSLSSVFCCSDPKVKNNELQKGSFPPSVFGSTCSDKLCLVAAGLGAAGAEDEANEDNHEDEHRDDGKEDPDNRSNLNSLNSCIKVKRHIQRAASN